MIEKHQLLRFLSRNKDARAKELKVKVDINTVTMTPSLFRDYDIFGRKKSKKQRKREILAENRAKGRAGEDIVRMKYALQGYEVERTAKGSDFRVRRRDLFTGRVVERKVVEVKTGKAGLSKLQKKTKKRKKRYKVERVEPLFY